MPQYTWITSSDFIYYGALVENGIEIIFTTHKKWNIPNFIHEN